MIPSSFGLDTLEGNMLFPSTLCSLAELQNSSRHSSFCTLPAHSSNRIRSCPLEVFSGPALTKLECEHRGYVSIDMLHYISIVARTLWDRIQKRKLRLKGVKQLALLSKVGQLLWQSASEAQYFNTVKYVFLTSYSDWIFSRWPSQWRFRNPGPFCLRALASYGLSLSEDHLH